MPTLDLQQVIAVADTLLQVNEDIFADAAGTPVTEANRQNAHRFRSLAVSAFASVIEHADKLIPTQLNLLDEQPSSFIHELSAVQAAAHESAVQQQKLIVKSCLAAALYAEDSALLTPWSSHQLHLASSNLLNNLSRSVCRNKPTAASFAGHPSSQQDFLLSFLPALLSELLPNFKTKDSYEEVSFNADTGPGTFQRCLAARQLACFVRQLDYQHLKGQVDRVLPHLIAVVKDQAPSVQCYGLHALQHLAKEALSADLKAHQRQLMTLAQEVLVGCEDTVWPVAAPTACAIVYALGSGGPGSGYLEVMQELLKQADMQAHKPNRTLVWLQAITPVFAVLGLHTLRFFTSLMPLVLRCCHDRDVAIQLSALQALQEIVQHTWPRMTAHAGFLWSQLQDVATQHEECCVVLRQHSSTTVADEATHPHAEIKNCLSNITQMLYWCGDSAFQTQLHALKQAREPGTSELLQSVVVA